MEFGTTVRASISAPFKTSAVAEMFGVCSVTVGRWVKRGLLRPVRINRSCVRFTNAEIQRFIQERSRVCR